MRKAFLLFLVLIGQDYVALSQESVVFYENLKFQTGLEKTFWISGKEDPFLLFRAVKADPTMVDSNWEALVYELDKKASKKKNTYNFLRAIFEKTHKQLLKKYKQHSTFNQMLQEGNYDCVSGSAALGLLLERYGYDFDIIETDYHVFLVVKLDDKEVVLESTLSVGGMITSSTRVKEYLNSYAPGQYAQLKSFTIGLAGAELDYNDNSIFRKVNLTQLAGLQYYNDAIVHFNAQDFIRAVEQLSKAYTLYPSERILGHRELSIEMAYKTFGYEIKN